jgi:membrane associated rhomboid family serine protease
MGSSGIVSFIIILNTVIFTYQGIKNHLIFEKYKFNVDKVLLQKEYWRLLTSGLIHVSWMHLIFNMLTLYLLSNVLESQVGTLKFILIYLGGLIGGNLFALLIHSKHGDYSSAGASGAVNAVIFSSIALFPGMGIGLFFIPVSIPGWLFAILFTLYSIYGVKSNKDNIGHEAHLGGALAGVLLAISFYPSALIANYIPILATVIPIGVFIYFVLTRPEILLIDNFFFKKHQKYTIDQEYNLSRKKKEMQLDEILDKIQKKGIQNLTREEMKKLKEYSKQL